MSQLTPAQKRWRERIEAALTVVGPVLDLVLAAGDRFSRIVVRDERPPATEIVDPDAAAANAGRRRALSDGAG